MSLTYFRSNNNDITPVTFWSNVSNIMHYLNKATKHKLTEKTGKKKKKRVEWAVCDNKKVNKTELLHCSFQVGRWVGWSLLHGRRKCASSLQWKCPRRWRRSPLLRTQASAGHSEGRSGTDTGRTSPCSGGLAGYDGAASLQDGQTHNSDWSTQDGDSTDRRSDFCLWQKLTVWWNDDTITKY